MKNALLPVLTCCTVLTLPAGRAMGQDMAPSVSPFVSVHDRAAQPRFRWWWPGALVKPAEIRREVDEMADAGFGGFELADVYDTISAPIDPKVYGWGTDNWKNAVSVALDQAARRGMTVDLTLGPHWPSAVPTITPQSPAAAQEMVHGQKILSAGESFSGKVPDPILPPSGQNQGNPDVQVENHLIAVLALQCSSDCTAKDDAPVHLRAKSVIDLTDRVKDGALSWTAPAEGNWIVLSIWHRATGQRVNMYDDSPDNSPVTDPRSYVVDHFGKLGAEAVVDYWNEDLLTPEIKAGLKKVGGAFFEDSLELKALQYWTPGVLQAFAARRGYDLRPYLPVLMFKTLKTWSAPAERAFVFDDTVLDRNVERDWAQTLSELWHDNRLETFKTWAASLGMIYRNQGYGGPVDSILSAATTGQPEGESLGFAGQPGKFQALRAGRDMGSGGLLSDEMGAFFKGYETQWTVDMLPTINLNFAYGVNQLYIHGYAYDDAPGASWPGFSPFGAMFSEAWNGKQPSWAHINHITGYLTRTQGVLQAGVNRTDLAVLRTQYDLDGGYLRDKAEGDAGYTLGYLSPAVLALPAATVTDGRLKADGPAFKALIVPLDEQLDADMMDRIATLHDQGLPIILLGKTPEDMSATPLARRIAALDWPRAATEADLPKLLGTLGITPDAAPQAPATLHSIHRHTQDGEDYYLFNAGDKALTTQITLKGKGHPTLLNAWTGKTEAVGPWSRTDGGVSLQVSLQPSQTRIIRLSGNVTAAHVTLASAEVTDVTPDAVILRAEKAGSVSATLSDGQTVTADAPDVPAAMTLHDWTLVIDARSPGEADNVIMHSRIDAGTLDKLSAWTDIPAVAQASGIGDYRTSVRLPDSWTKEMGAWIKIPEHHDTIRIWVNGQNIGPVDQLATKIDLGHSLQPGDNTIRIEVTTPLANAMLKYEPDVFNNLPGGPRKPLETGLIGEITLQPYTDVTLTR